MLPLIWDEKHRRERSGCVQTLDTKTCQAQRHKNTDSRTNYAVKYATARGHLKPLHARQQYEQKYGLQTAEFARFWSIWGHILYRCLFICFPCIWGAGVTSVFLNKIARALIHQRTREGCGCFRGLFGGYPEKTSGKSRENCRKHFPNHEKLQIPGFQVPGKANLPGSLGQHCLDLVPPPSVRGVFLKSTVPGCNFQPSRVFLIEIAARSAKSQRNRLNL